MTEPWRISEQERELVRRVLTVVLREDVGGLRSRGELVAPVVGEHWWLRLNRLRVPVEPADPERGDLLTDLAVRAPMVVHGRHVGRTSEVGRLDGVLAVLAQELPVGLADDAAAELRAGLVDLRAEADAALAAAELRAQRRPAVLERIAEVLGPGWAGAIGYEWLAAHRDHPFYPASLARVGLPTADLPRFAPEHAPTLDLRWVSLPADGFSVAGGLPDWWPSVPEGRIAIPCIPRSPWEQHSPWEEGRTSPNSASWPPIRRCRCGPCSRSSTPAST